MTETETPETRLWTESGFRDDPWRHGESADDLDAGGKVILPLEAFLELDEETRARHRGAIGVKLLPGERIDALLPHLADLPLAALAFPAFSDGRSYSKAELLRRRHGFKGTLRACGDVLIDQVPLMLRTGFDELEVTNGTALRRLAEGRPGGIAYHYQPGADDRHAASARFSWRRRPAA